MKILYLVHQFYPMHYTGTEKVILNIAAMMRKMGHKVKVMTYSFYEDSFYDKEDGEIISKEFLYHGIDVLAFRHKTIPMEINSQMRDNAIADIAEAMIDREKPDIVHVGHPMRVAELVFASKRLGIPYVITLTDFWLICPKFTLVNDLRDLCSGPQGCKTCLEDCPEFGDSEICDRLDEAKQLMMDASKVIAPSGFLAGIFKNEVPMLDVEVIKHGLRYGNLRENKRRYGKEDVITFCYCGSFNEHKGVHILIEAVRKVKSDRVRLKIYGSGDPVYTSRLKEMTSGESRIEFCGVYSDVQAADVYTSVDVIVVPSLWYETYGLVLREAFLCSVPVLASNVGVMAEAVKDGVNGFVFRIGDTAHLQSMIEKILDDPEMLNRMKAETTYDFVPTVEQEAYAYNRVYKEVLSGEARQYPCSLIFSSVKGE